jgi:hypothetical protein
MCSLYNVFSIKGVKARRHADIWGLAGADNQQRKEEEEEEEEEG